MNNHTLLLSLWLKKVPYMVDEIFVQLIVVRIRVLQEQKYLYAGAQAIEGSQATRNSIKWHQQQHGNHSRKHLQQTHFFKLQISHERMEQKETISSFTKQDIKQLGHQSHPKWNMQALQHHNNKHSTAWDRYHPRVNIKFFSSLPFTAMLTWRATPCDSCWEKFDLSRDWCCSDFLELQTISAASR